jgi:hypothetical protein
MRTIGTVEGIIMPTIIMVHIANTNANSIGRHGLSAGIMSPIPDGIIRKPVMSIPSISMSDASQSK